MTYVDGIAFMAGGEQVQYLKIDGGMLIREDEFVDNLRAEIKKKPKKVGEIKLEANVTRI